MPDRPHIVLIVPRGEAVRNFLYSDTLSLLSQNARVTLLSVIHDEQFVKRFGPYADQIIPLREHRENRLVTYLRSLVHETHFRWLWSEVAQNRWEVREHEARTRLARLKVFLWRKLIDALSARAVVESLASLERRATIALCPTDEFHRLFEQLKPDLVFNGSHIHGPAGGLPTRVAYQMKIPTVGFIFSWDNLTSRSRIMEPYNYYLVWHQHMRDQLLSIYPHIRPDQVFITGTPQFDFHFKPEFHLSREDLCARIGIDPTRPYLLYTTGIDRHFPEEHRTVQWVIDLMRSLDVRPRPQLVVRTYVKGTSQEMKAIAAQHLPDVVFPEVQWDPKWFMPRYDDLAIYTSLLRHAALGINAASTVSLELLVFNKPVINLDFDPPGSNLPACYAYHRHLKFDHYQPVAASGAVMVARSAEEMREMLYRGLAEPEKSSATRKYFVERLFGNTLDGCSGNRVAHRLLALAVHEA